MKIFWSWQSDNNEKCGRYFIRDVLDIVASQLNALEGTDEATRGDDVGPIELDHDTKGVAGSPPIAETILEKISDAAVFVADVTPVGTTGSGKRLANPNVMIELGYAIKSLGHNQIVLVMNEAEQAKLDTLPFDLRHWRGPIVYDLSSDATQDFKQEQKKLLTQAMLNRIEPIISFAKQKKAKNQFVSSPMPAFELALVNGKGEIPKAVSQNVMNLGIALLDEIKAKSPKLPIPETDPVRRFRPSQTMSSMGFGSTRVPVSEWTIEEVINFNERLEGYYLRYEKYINELEKYRQLQLRALHIKLDLTNVGSKPASNIDVEIGIPDGLLIFEEDKFPVPPLCPQPPELEPVPTPKIYRVPEKYTSFNPRDESIWLDLDTENRRIRFHVDELKHGYHICSQLFFLVFETMAEIGSKEIPISISANETPQHFKGKLKLDIALEDV